MPGDQTRSDQRSSRVGGHQAGRDVVINQITEKPNLMKTLITLYKEEIEKNSDFKEIIASLEHYITQLPGDDFAGLSDKLEAADRANQILEAENLKELFSKKLMKNRFSESAQHILSYVLGRIYELYAKNIRPLIENGEEKPKIDSALYDDVVETVFDELDENVLLINYQELIGAVFYLTGNCHIKWHK